MRAVATALSDGSKPDVSDEPAASPVEETLETDRLEDAGVAIEGPDVELWDLATHRQLASLRGHTGPVQALAFSPGGKLLATGSFDTTVKLWDVAARREIPSRLKHKTALKSLAFSPTGQILAAGSWGGIVKL